VRYANDRTDRFVVAVVVSIGFVIANWTVQLFGNLISVSGDRSVNYEEVTVASFAYVSLFIIVLVRYSPQIRTKQIALVSFAGTFGLIVIYGFDLLMSQKHRRSIDDVLGLAFLFAIMATLNFLVPWALYVLWKALRFFVRYKNVE